MFILSLSGASDADEAVNLSNGNNGNGLEMAGNGRKWQLSSVINLLQATTLSARFNVFRCHWGGAIPLRASPTFS